MTRGIEGSEQPMGAQPAPPTRESATILIVGGAPDFRASLVRRLSGGRHECTHVNRYDEAETALSRQRFDLLLLEADLPDRDGLDLAHVVHRVSPTTKMVVFSETSSFRLALRALRCGAIDFIRTPVGFEEFMERVTSALDKSLAEKKREERIMRLQTICRDLDHAREEISGQVDTLCKDLLTAYRDLSEQITDVAMATEFRTLLSLELDMEESLRTTLEYFLTKTGPTNAAVFLPDLDGTYSLGAYVNYDCPRESIDTLLDHLGQAICPQMSEETDLIAFDDAQEFASWIELDDGFLADAQVIAFSCRHHHECMAVIVLFRNSANPFDGQLAKTLDILRTIFAEQLSQIVRVHHRAMPEWPDDVIEDDYDDFGLAA